MDPRTTHAASDRRDAPKTWLGTMRELGPGLIIAASIVGSGELVVTTKLGADVGYVLLWFIILGCLVKVFVQIELGRYAIACGRTSLQALDSIPGPRLRMGWLVYIWLLMFVCTFFQLAGMVGLLAKVLRLGGVTSSDASCAVFTALSCTVLLAIGRYRWIERVSTTMVALFTFVTLAAVVCLQWTPYAIQWRDLSLGLSGRLPDQFTAAFAAFGIIGVGAAELIYYPYWCLEKGYARAVGPNDQTAAWGERARAWLGVLRVDAWFSLVIYTTATLAFYLLGAAVLHGKGIAVTTDTIVPSLSHMYRETFGVVGLWIYLIGAFFVLYSTVFVSTASNGRLLADLLHLSGLVRHLNQRQHDQGVWWATILLPFLYLAFFFLVGDSLQLVMVGAIAQSIMLPVMCGAALYLHHFRMDPHLRPSLAWTVTLWIAAILMTATAAYEVSRQGAALMKAIFSVSLP